MKKKDRITELERKIIELEARLASVETNRNQIFVTPEVVRYPNQPYIHWGELPPNPHEFIVTCSSN